MKLIKYIATLCMTALIFTACEETSEVSEYDNWKQRNIAYIDSIAEVAKANEDGQWKVFRNFNLNDTDKDGNPVTWENEDYIYCHVKKEGTGSDVQPKFTDTVAVNYRGRLMPTESFPMGSIFDQSYKGTLNPAVNAPAYFACGSVIEGWSTALQEMHVGDQWRVYIPAKLGYKNKEQTKIPAHSALVFDINLVAIYPTGTPVPRH